MDSRSTSRPTLYASPSASDSQTAVGNQGRFLSTATPRRWAGLQFATDSELAVAQALDAAGLLFFPGAAVRLTDMDGVRRTREVDFVVVDHGKVGILELDGWPHTGRAAEDHRRDRAIKRAGIWLIERISSAEALRDPHGVARTFQGELRHFRRTA